MAEWLYEAGIGENRAALVARGVIWKAAIELPGGPRTGTTARARLIDRVTGKIQLETGEEALCDPLPPGITQGASFTARIVREAIAEAGRAKLPKAVPADAPPMPGPDLLTRIKATDLPVRQLRAHEPDLLEDAGWSELLEEAATGEIAFAGGALRMTVTPAMTLFDVDGAAPLGALSISAAHAIAQAMERMEITGSVGIDFPTLANKNERNAVAEAIDAALPQPFERTAMNGFGFLQVVRRRSRMSMPELLAADPAGAALRGELRRLERLPPPAPDTHMLHPALLRRLEREPEWVAELHRRTGGRTRFLAEFVEQK